MDPKGRVMTDRHKSEHEDKEAPVVPPRVVNIDRGYFGLPRAEQRAFLRNLIESLSPDEDVRKKAREEAERRRNQD